MSRFKTIDAGHISPDASKKLQAHIRATDTPGDESMPAVFANLTWSRNECDELAWSLQIILDHGSEESPAFDRRLG